jgi:hypothetical protein
MEWAIVVVIIVDIAEVDWIEIRMYKRKLLLTFIKKVESVFGKDYYDMD